MEEYLQNNKEMCVNSHDVWQPYNDYWVLLQIGRTRRNADGFKTCACLTIHISASLNISTALLASFVYNLF